MIIKIMIIMMMIIITTTTMALSFNRGYHWRNGCPELNYVYPLWVNICLEKAVKPIDTFYSFCRFVEAIYPFLLQKKNRIQNSVSVRWSIQIEKIGSAYYIYIHISYISYTHHIHITLVVPSRQCLFTYFIKYGVTERTLTASILVEFPLNL